MNHEYNKAAEKWLSAFQLRVSDFCPAHQSQGWNVLDVSFGHETWAFIKLTGRWPLWDFIELVGTDTLAQCPLWAARSATVTHVLSWNQADFSSISVG